MRRLTVLYLFIASAMVVGQTTIHCYCISKYYANFAPIDFYVLSILLTLQYTDLLQYLYYCMPPHVRRYCVFASMTYLLPCRFTLQIFIGSPLFIGLHPICVLFATSLYMIRFTLSYVFYISVSAFVISDSSIVVHLYYWIGSIFLPFSMLGAFIP